MDLLGPCVRVSQCPSLFAPTYPPHATTGSGGYRGNRGSTAASPQRTKTLRVEASRRRCSQSAQRPAGAASRSSRRRSSGPSAPAVAHFDSAWCWPGPPRRASPAASASTLAVGAEEQQQVPRLQTGVGRGDRPRSSPRRPAAPDLHHPGAEASAAGGPRRGSCPPGRAGTGTSRREKSGGISTYCAAGCRRPGWRRRWRAAPAGPAPPGRRPPAGRAWRARRGSVPSASTTGRRSKSLLGEDLGRRGAGARPGGSALLDRRHQVVRHHRASAARGSPGRA